jgi:hypothetical protein
MSVKLTEVDKKLKFYISKLTVKMFKLESSPNRFAGHFVFEDLFWGVVAGYYYSSWPDSHTSSFGFSDEGIVVCPVLEMRSEYSVLLTEVVKENSVLTLVLAPPFVKGLVVDVLPSCSCSS